MGSPDGRNSGRFGIGGVILLGLLICFPTQMRGEGIYTISLLPVSDLREQGEPHRSPGLTCYVYSYDVAAFADRLRPRFPKMELHEQRIKLTLDHYSSVGGQKPDRYLRDSFLIDYREPIFTDLQSMIARKYGKRPTPQELTGFVRAYIHNKNLERSFDLASQTAKLRAGDCTEHAVLLTALMRLHQIPARVMLGVVLFGEKKIQGGYHAWVEYYRNGRYLPADASFESYRPPRYYLPLGSLENESLTYHNDIVHFLNYVRRIEIH